MGRLGLDADVVAALARAHPLAALLPLHAPGLRLVRVGVVEAPEHDALAGPRLGVLLVLRESWVTWVKCLSNQCAKL